MYKRFENIQDPTRYKRRREHITSSTLYYSYLKKYNLTIYDIPQKDFGAILKTFNEVMYSEAMLKGTIFRFPHKAGFFGVFRKILPKPLVKFNDIAHWKETGETKFRDPILYFDNFKYFNIKSTDPERTINRSLVFEPFKRVRRYLSKLSATTNVGKNYSQKFIK